MVLLRETRGEMRSLERRVMTRQQKPKISYVEERVELRLLIIYREEEHWKVTSKKLQGNSLSLQMDTFLAF